MKKTTRQTPPDPAPSPDLITQLEQLGSLFFSPSECARIVGRTDLERFGSELATGTSEAGQAFQRGRLQAEVAVIDRVMSGRPSKNAILTRIIALARKHGRITTAAAVRLTGKTDRALRKAFPKVPPLAQGSTR